MVRAVTRTGRIRPGPQTNSTVGTCDCGHVAVGKGAEDPPIAARRRRTLPITEPPAAAEKPGWELEHLQRRQACVDAGVSASPCATGLPSAIMSWCPSPA